MGEEEKGEGGCLTAVRAGAGREEACALSLSETEVL